MDQIFSVLYSVSSVFDIQSVQFLIFSQFSFLYYCCFVSYMFVILLWILLLFCFLYSVSSVFDIMDMFVLFLIDWL